MKTWTPFSHMRVYNAVVGARSAVVYNVGGVGASVLAGSADKEERLEEECVRRLYIYI